MEIIAFSGFFYLEIFTASSSGSDDFVLFNSLDGNKLNSQFWMEPQLICNKKVATSISSALKG